MLAAAGAAVAQTPVPQSVSAPPRAENDPDLEAARQQARTNAELINRVKLPMTTEPAVHFKA